MSFHASAQDIRLDDGHMLRARLYNVNGEEVDAEVDLNQFIGNNDGNFEWGGENFSGSAEDINFSLEGDDNVPILRAGLMNMEGELVYRDINLSERIGNNDGQFEFRCMKQTLQ
ncbi:hypothetical protein N0V88_007219 [Collariella sp. IMI 366227]|nr:hypothetical protein N0V88_007219 [Collariella sp. IMI 366227]